MVDETVDVRDALRAAWLEVNASAMGFDASAMWEDALATCLVSSLALL